MNGKIINIDKAVVSFRTSVALRGVSLDVNAGEFIGIIGPNGAGKTTLLTIINGMSRPCSGQVQVLGHLLRPGNGHELRKKIGYMPQSQNIDPRMPMSVRETVMIGRYGVLGVFRRPGRHDWEVVDDVLEMAGVSHLAARPIGQLSGGELQRAALARCMAQEPELLLLDEPTASLDWKARNGLIELIKLINITKRLTTLFVTHDLGSLPPACDRVLLMKEGNIWAEGYPDALLTDETLSELYDMPVIEVRRRRQVSVAG